jgi:hypothetical protein
VETLDGEADFLGLKRHAYESPFNRDRTGQLLEQRHEPYVELGLAGKACRILSLFALDDGEASGSWKREGGTWSFQNGSAEVLVTCSEGKLHIRESNSERELSVHPGLGREI